APRISRRGRRALRWRQRAIVVAILVMEAERLRQVGIEFAQPRTPVGRLRRLAQSLRRRLARPVRGGEIGAAVEGIVGRRLQSGLRTRSGGSLADAWIEQVGERRLHRRLLRPRRLGARRLRRVLLGMLGRIALWLWLWRGRLVGSFCHRPNMEPRLRWEKGGTWFRTMIPHARAEARERAYGPPIQPFVRISGNLRSPRGSV